MGNSASEHRWYALELEFQTLLARNSNSLSQFSLIEDFLRKWTGDRIPCIPPFPAYVLQNVIDAGDN
jgi:hypothetical protein